MIRLPLRGPRGLALAGLVLCGAVAAPPVSAAPPGPVHRYHLAPAPGRNYTFWTLDSIAQLSPHDLGNFDPLRPDEFLRTQFLADPDTVYSDLRPEIFTSTGLQGLPGYPTPRRQMAWDLGFDKALPDYQGFARAHADEFTAKYERARPHLVKAGVRPAYFESAYHAAGGTTLSTLSAELAVAAEVLREWVDEVTEPFQSENDIRADVLERFERATMGEALPQADLDYFADILRGELSRYQDGKASRYDQRQLPTPLRIARVAAAYRLTQDGAPWAACLADGSVNITHAATDPTDATRPLCFTDATDRAVHAWYLAERERQLRAPTLDCEGGPLPCQRLADAFASLRPVWAGAFDASRLVHANRAEVIETQIAQEANPVEVDDTAFLRMLQRLHMAVYP